MIAEHLRFSRRHLLEIDWLLVLCLLALTVTGLVVIDGARWPVENELSEDNPSLVSSQAMKQFLFWMISLGALGMILVFDYKVLEKLAWPFYILCIIALAVLLIRQQTTKGAASWFDLSAIGLPVRLQPSEFTKVALVLVLAHWMSSRAGQMRRLSDLIIPGLIILIPLALIAKQPDFGTAAVLIPVGFALLWTGGIRKRYVYAALVIGVLAVASVYPYLKDYQKQRIMVFIKPASADIRESGWNIYQAEITLGSGRLLGKGWRNGTQTALEFLPEHHTDFIFPSLGEQFGFVGMVVILLLYLLVVMRSLAIAKNAKDWFGGFLVIGLIAIFITHMLLNIGMVLRIFPVTGLPLPFLSYGGSFLLTNYIIFGIILNVGMRKYFFD